MEESLSPTNITTEAEIITFQDPQHGYWTPMLALYGMGQNQKVSVMSFCLGEDYDNPHDAIKRGVDAVRMLSIPIYCGLEIGEHRYMILRYNKLLSCHEGDIIEYKGDISQQDLTRNIAGHETIPCHLFTTHKTKQWKIYQNKKQ